MHIRYLLPNLKGMQGDYKILDIKLCKLLIQEYSNFIDESRYSKIWHKKLSEDIFAIINYIENLDLHDVNKSNVVAHYSRFLDFYVDLIGIERSKGDLNDQSVIVLLREKPADKLLRRINKNLQREFSNATKAIIDINARDTS
tara:strand:- start:3966 stop:4394 length:429 start_codon:yes stop_codon:yes gene_type:complete